MSWDGGDHEHDNDHLITRRHGRIRKRNKIIIAVGIVTLIVLVAVGVTLGVVLSRKHDTSKNVTTTVTTVKPSAPLEEKLTIAFYTGQRAPPKTNSVAWLLQQLDGGTGSSSDSTQTVLLNVAQKWKDDLASGKMTVSFVPYDKVAGQTSDTLTSYDAIEAYINNAYKNLATLGDKEDPSQTDATKKYSGSLSNKDPTASFLLFAPKISDYKGDAATDMKQAGVNLKTIADKTRKTAVAGAGLSVEQAGYYGVPASVVQVILDASQNEDEIGNIFSPPSDLSTSTQATTTTTQGLDLSKTVTIALFSGKSAAIKKDDTKQVILDIITDWKPALTAGDVKVQFIRYVDQVVDTSQVLTTADEATTYVNDAYNSLLDVTGKDASQAVATEAFLDQIKQAMGVDSAGFLLFSAPLEAYKDKAGTVDMQAAGKNLNEIAGQIATTAVAAADIPDTQLQYNLGDGMKVTVFGNALSDSGDIAEKFVPGSKPKPPVLDLGKTVTIAFFTGMTNAMSKDDVSDTQQVILDVIADWKPALAAGDVGVRFIPYTDQVQSTSKTFTTADDATKFVNDAYNALKDIGGKDANQAGAASEFFDQAKLAKNAASAGFLLFSAPHRAYADNVGTTDMQAAGKLLNHIAGTVANTAAAAADIPLNQLQYNLGDGTKVTLFGDALSDPGAIAEKFVPGSNPSQPEAPLALTISFYAGTKGAKNDPQFKETKGLLSALVAFWSKAIDSGRLTLTFIRYDTNFVASDTFTFLDAVNQYLNGLTTPTVLAAGKEPSQSSAIRHFVDASAKVPNSALLHLAAPEGDYQADAAKDMTDSGSLLKTLSTSLKHVTLAGVDISKDVLAKFGLAGADKVDIVEQAQKHAPEIANQFIPNSVPSLAKTVTIAFFSGKSNTFAKDDTQQVILDVISDWTSALTAGDVKVRFIRYTDSVQDTSKDFTTADESTKFVNDAYNALTDMGGKDASQAAAADEFLNQAVLSTNADSAGFLLFAAPLAAYKNNAAGTADMQAAGKSLNNIAVGVANAAVAAADIPANQLQYNLGDGTKVTVFGNAVSDPGDIAEKFVPGSKPSKPKTPLALSISFYAGTKDASKDQQFKDTKTLLSGLVTFWTKAINSGRLTLSFIRYDADLVASDTLTTVDAVNQYLNTLTKPTVLASGKEPSQASAIRHFVDVATKVPNSAFLHLAAPEGDYLTNAVKDMTDSGAQLRVLSVSLKHVTLSGVDIKKDVLTKFGLTAADKVNVIDEAQDHAAEIANEFIPSPEVLTIAFYDGSRSGNPTNDPTQKVLLDLVAKWKQFLASGELKISFIGYSSTAEEATAPSDDPQALTKIIKDAFRNPNPLGDGDNPSQEKAVQKYKEKAPATKDPLSKFILFSVPMTGEYVPPPQASTDMAKAGQALEEVSPVLGKAGVAGVGLTDEDMEKYNFGDIAGITAYPNAATKEDQIAKDFCPEPKTMPAPPKVIDDVTIAFFAAKPSATAAGGKRFENVFYRRKRDGADAALPDDAILMNALVDDWSDALSAGKLKIVFLPYTDSASAPVIKTTVKDAKDYITATYAALPAWSAGKDPSQEAAVKAYQSQTATHETKSGFLLISAPVNAYSAQQKMTDDMDATGKVVKAVSTQLNQLATVIAGSYLTAAGMSGYGDVGSSVSTVPQAQLHPQEIADKFVPPTPERLTIAFYTGKRLPKAGKQGGSVLLSVLGVDDLPSPTKADEELLASVLIPLKDKIVDGRLKVSFIKYDVRPSQKTPDLDDFDRISSYILEAYAEAVGLADGEDPHQQEAVAEFNTALFSDASPSTASFLLIPPPRSEYSTTDALNADEFTTGVLISETKAGRIAIAGASLDARDVAEYSLPKESKAHIFEDATEHAQEISDLFDPTKPAGTLPKPPVPTKLQVTIAFYNGVKRATGGSGGAVERDDGVIPGGMKPPALENTHQLLKDIVARWKDQLRAGQLDVSFVRYADQAEEPTVFVGTDKATLDQINAYIDDSFAKPKGYDGTKDPSQTSAVVKYEASSITSTSSFLLVAPPMTEYSAATASTADLSAAGAGLVRVKQKVAVTAVTGADLTEAQAVGYGLAVNSGVRIFPEAAKNRDSKAIADYLVAQPPTRLVISFFLATRAAFETGNPAVNENLAKTQALLNDLITGWQDALSQNKLVLSFLTYGKMANKPSHWLTTVDAAYTYVDHAFKIVPELLASDNPDQEAALKEYLADVFAKETFFETAEFLHLAPDTAVYDDPVNARANAMAAGVYLTGFAPQAGSSGVSVIGLGGTALKADEIGWYNFEKDSPVKTFASAVEASAIAAAFDPLSVPPVKPPVPEKPPQAAKQRLIVGLYNGVKSAGATTLADTKTLLLSVISNWRDALVAKDIEISFLNYADKESAVPANMGSSKWLNSLESVQNYINENIAAPTVLAPGNEPSQDSVVKAYSTLLAAEPDPQRYSFLLVTPPSADYAATAKADRQAAGSDLNKLAEGKTALIGSDLTADQASDYALKADIPAFIKADDQSMKAASFFVSPPKLASLTIAFSVAEGSTLASGAVLVDDVTQKLLKEVVSSASWTQGLTDGTLQITLLPYAATAQPSKGPFTKLADVTTAIDQAFAGLVPLKDGEVLSQRSAVDAYMMASSADRYPSADSFLLLAPSNLAVYLPIDDARKDFAATGKQLNAIAKVVGKVGVGGVTLSSGLIAGYGLDANVASFAKATADPIVKEFAPTPTSTGGDGGGPTGGKPGGGGPTGGKPGGGDPLGGKNPPGEGVPPVRQPDPDLCYWDQ